MYILFVNCNHYSASRRLNLILECVESFFENFGEAIVLRIINQSGVSPNPFDKCVSEVISHRPIDCPVLSEAGHMCRYSLK